MDSIIIDDTPAGSPAIGLGQLFVMIRDLWVVQRLTSRPRFISSPLHHGDCIL